jgi:hypothetical protein
MENNRVERPPKPVIRFSIPIFSNDDRFLGVIVLDYLEKQILDKKRNENQLIAGELMPVNSDTRESQSIQFINA